MVGIGTGSHIGKMPDVVALVRRSLNAQVEVLLRRALAETGRMPKHARPLPKRGRPRTRQD